MVNRDELKIKFGTGRVPTENDFARLIDGLGAIKDESIGKDVSWSSYKMNQYIQDLKQKDAETTAQLAQTTEKAIDVPYHLKPTTEQAVDKGESTAFLRDMSKSGIVYAVQGNWIASYDDTSETFDNVINVGFSASFLLALDNEELLFGRKTEGQTAEIYVTENNQTSFKKVLNGSDTGNAFFSNTWGKSTYGNIVVISEYGDRGKAKGVYLSTDYGNTFSMVFNLLEHAASPSDAHIHGSAYDPYWKRIWVVNGDLANSSIYWSDDLGATWETVGTPFNQLLNVIPMRNCVLFGADSVPYAIYRMDRISKETMPKLNIAHIFADDTVGHLSYIPRMMHKRDDDSPVVINITPENPSRLNDYSEVKVITTNDGFNFYEMFNNSVTSLNDTTLLSYFPTKNNKFAAQTSDRKLFVSDAPKWNKGTFEYSTPFGVLDKKIEDIYVDVRDFGVRNVTEDRFNFGNTNALKHALEYCADNNKILYVPKSVTVSIGDITIENKSNFGLKIDGKLKAKAINGLFGLVFKNCDNIRVYDINGTYGNYDTPYRDRQSIVKFENCNDVYFDNIVADNVYSNVVEFANCNGIYGNVIKGEAEDTGANVAIFRDCENVFIDTIINDGVGSDIAVGGVLIETTTSETVSRNLNFKEIQIKNNSTRSLTLDAKSGILENVNLGNVSIVNGNGTGSTVYGVALLKCNNVKGALSIESTGNNTLGIYTDDVDGLVVDLDIKSVSTGFHQANMLSNSEITGKIDTCTYRALSLANLENFECFVNFGKMSGTQYSVTTQGSGVYTNVTFYRNKFERGTNNGAVEFNGTTTNVRFRGCDLSAWADDILKTVRSNSTALDVVRIECLGINYRNAPPTTGRWNYGEMVYNNEPAPGEYQGWICTVAGAFGVMQWKSFGMIEA